jgi:hypothetical protein
MAFKDTGRPRAGLVVSVLASSLTNGWILAAPGENKQYVILSIGTTSNGSLGTAADGATRVYYMRDGNITFPLGFSLGENKGLSTDVTGTNYISITYYIEKA